MEGEKVEKVTKVKGKGKGKQNKEKKQPKDAKSDAQLTTNNNKAGGGGGDFKSSVGNDVSNLFHNMLIDTATGKTGISSPLTKLCTLATATIDIDVSKSIVKGLVGFLDAEKLKHVPLKHGLSLLRHLNSTSPTSKLHHTALIQYFDDLVDVLLGWAMTEGLGEVRDDVMDTLQSLAPQWGSKVDIARNMLQCLTEDIGVITEFKTEKEDGSAYFTRMSAPLACLGAISFACPSSIITQKKADSEGGKVEVSEGDLVLKALLKARECAETTSTHMDKWRETACSLVKVFTDALPVNELLAHYPLFVTLLLGDCLLKGADNGDTLNVNSITNQRRQRHILLQHASLFNKLPSHKLEGITLEILKPVFNPSNNDELVEDMSSVYCVGGMRALTILCLLRGHIMGSQHVISFWRRGERTYKSAAQTSASTLTVASSSGQSELVTNKQSTKQSDDERDVLLETFVGFAGTGAASEMFALEISMAMASQDDGHTSELEVAYFNIAVLQQCFQRHLLSLDCSAIVLNIRCSALEPTSSSVSTLLPGFVSLVISAARHVVQLSDTTEMKPNTSILLEKFPQQLASLGLHLVEEASEQVSEQVSEELEQGLALVHTALSLGTNDVSMDWSQLIHVLVRLFSKSSVSSIRLIVTETLGMLAQRHLITGEHAMTILQVVLRQQFTVKGAHFDTLSMELVGLLSPCLLSQTSTKAVRSMGDSHRLQRKLLRWSGGVEHCIAVEDVKKVLQYLCLGSQDKESEGSFCFAEWCVSRFIAWSEVVDPSHTKAWTLVGAVQRNPIQAQLWMCWQAARMVVKSRLKTHFGGPKETFNAIERALRPSSSSSPSSSTTAPVRPSSASVRPANRGGRTALSGRGLEGQVPRALVQIRNTPPPPPASTAAASLPVEASRPPPVARDLLRDRLLLVLVDALEKHIYHASNGTSRIGHRSLSTTEEKNSDKSESDSDLDKIESARKECERMKSRALHSESGDSFVLPAPSPNCEAFFRNNKRVCEDWFARIRSLQMSLAAYSLSAPDVVRQAMLRLGDLTRRMGAICSTSPPQTHKEGETDKVAGRGNDLQKAWNDVESLLIHTAKSLCSLRDAEGITGLIEWHLGVKRQITSAAKGAQLTSYDADANPSTATRLLGLRLTAQSRHEELLQVPNLDMSDKLATLGALKQFDDVGKVMAAGWWRWADSDSAVSSSVSRTSLSILASWAGLEDSETERPINIAEPTDVLRKSEAAVQRVLSAKRSLHMKAVDMRTLEKSVTQAHKALSPFIILDGVDPAANEEIVRCDMEPWLTKCGLLSVVSLKLSSSSTLSPVDMFKLDPKQHSLEPWLAFISVLKQSKNDKSESRDGVLKAMQCAVVKLARKQGNYKLAASCIQELTAKQEDVPNIDVSLFCQYESACLLFNQHQDDTEEAVRCLYDMTTELAKDNSTLLNCPSVNSLLLENNHSTDNSTCKKSEVRRDWLLRCLLCLNEWSVDGSSEVLGEPVCELAVRVCPLSANGWLKYAEWCYEQSAKGEGDTTKEEQTLLETSVSAYRQFLCLSDRSDLSVGAALRMVQLLVSGSLKHVSRQIALTPIAHWVRVAPQLLARLGHPNSEVADEVLLLLKRLAAYKPLSLVTQAVVAQGIKPKSKTEVALHSRYCELVKYLGESQQTLVDETEVFVYELNRVSYLWDEMWLALAVRLSSELESRVQVLNKDTIRLAAHTGLSEDEKVSLCLRRFQAVFTPLLSAVRLLAETTRMLVEGEEGDNAPLTPHEEWCLLVYKPLVLTLIESITQPDTPTYQESVQVQAAVAAAPTPYVAAVQRSNKTSDFVCFECGAVRGRYQHWDECLSHVRMHHPEIETRRKDDKANIREQCRKAAQLTSSSLSSTAVPSSADAKKSSVGSLEFQAPDKVWACFLQLQRLLFRNAEERTHESIREVSPRLAALSSTATHIILPTTGDSHQDSLRLTSLDDVVTLITTKTRPKQLSMHSADGKRRAYLLKGREDLHLDERVMQFLEVANDLVRGDRMRAVRFAVVPLGTQSGIIEWVPRAVPLFQVYRRWQRADNRGKLLLQQQQQQASSSSGRAAAALSPQVVKEIPPLLAALCTWVAEGGGSRGTPQMTAFYQLYPETKEQMKAAGGLRPFCDKYSSFVKFTHGKDPLNQLIVLVPQDTQAGVNVKTTTEVPSPASMFHRELVRTLESETGDKQEAVTKASLLMKTPRNNWPKTLLKKVRQRLSDSVPRNLFERELWLSSTSSSDWYEKQGCYTRSLALMSVVGYMLGLGDRHLDNILLDFSSGEVVHIDYGVCFDKGLSLKIPEIVPCRLTPLLLAGLGPTAAEGKFRSSCETTMSALRNNQSLLLGLLEAFIYDPLLDWSKDAALALEHRKNVDNSVTLSLFAARSAELLPGIDKRCSCTDLISDLVGSLPHLRDTCDVLVKALAMSAQLPLDRSKLVQLLSSAKKAQVRALMEKQSEVSKDSGRGESVSVVSAQVTALVKRCDVISSKAEHVITHLLSGSLPKALETYKEEAKVVSVLCKEKSVFMEGCQLVQEAVKVAGKKQTLLAGSQLQSMKTLCQKADASYSSCLKECHECFTVCATSLVDYVTALQGNNLLVEDNALTYVSQGVQFAVSREGKIQLDRSLSKQSAVSSETDTCLDSQHAEKAMILSSRLTLIQQTREKYSEVEAVLNMSSEVDDVTSELQRQVELYCSSMDSVSNDEVVEFMSGLSTHLKLISQLFETLRQSEDITGIESQFTSLLEQGEGTPSPVEMVTEARRLHAQRTQEVMTCEVIQAVELSSQIAAVVVAAYRTISQKVSDKRDTPDNGYVAVACRQLLEETSHNLSELMCATATIVKDKEVGSKKIMSLKEISDTSSFLSETEQQADVLMEKCLSDARLAFKYKQEVLTLKTHEKEIETDSANDEVDWEKEFDTEELKKDISRSLQAIQEQRSGIESNAKLHCQTCDVVVTRIGTAVDMLQSALCVDDDACLSPFVSELNKSASQLTHRVFELLTALDGGWKLCTVRNGKSVPCYQSSGDGESVVEWVENTSLHVGAAKPVSDVAKYVSSDGEVSLAMSGGAVKIVAKKLAWVRALTAVTRLHLQALQTTHQAYEEGEVPSTCVSKGMDVWCEGLGALLFGSGESKGMIPDTLLWCMVSVGATAQQCLGSNELTVVGTPSSSSSLLCTSNNDKTLTDSVATMTAWTELTSEVDSGRLVKCWHELTASQLRHDHWLRDIDWLQRERVRTQELYASLLTDTKRLLWLYGETISKDDPTLNLTDSGMRREVVNKMEVALLRLNACFETVEEATKSAIGATAEVEKCLIVLRQECGRPIGSRPLVDEQRVRHWRTLNTSATQQFTQIMSKCGSVYSTNNVADAIRSLLELERCMVGETVSKVLSQSADMSFKRLRKAKEYEMSFSSQRAEVVGQISESSTAVIQYESDLLTLEKQRLAAANELGIAAVTFLPKVTQVVKCLLKIAESLLLSPFKEKDTSSMSASHGSFSEVNQLSRHAARSLKESSDSKSLLEMVEGLLLVVTEAQKGEEVLVKIMKMLGPHRKSLRDLSKGDTSWTVVQSQTDASMSHLSSVADQTEVKAVAHMEKARPALIFTQQLLDLLDTQEGALDALKQTSHTDTETGGEKDEQGTWLSVRHMLSEVSESAQHTVDETTARAIDNKGDGEDEDDEEEEEEEEEEEAVVGEQERNEFAVSVLDRVGDRLAGKVDGEEVKEVRDQVGWLITQATNPDNLCQMYEGWASWI